MKIEESHQRQAQLDLYLHELAKKPLDDLGLQEMAIKLKELYSDGFRHNYSGFFPVILEVFQEDNEYNQDFLSTNLDSIRNLVEEDFYNNEDKASCKYIGLYKPLKKLSDHINLEIARYSHSIVRENKLIDLEKRNEDLKNKLKSAEESLENVHSSLQNAQKEYVAILGIFAAVVLAFTGGISYSTSLFENIHMASIYRILFGACLIGCTLFNLFYFLFTFLAEIIHKQEKRSHLVLWISNGVFSLLLVVIILAWTFGWVEKRDERLNSTITESSEEYTEITAVESLNDVKTETVIEPEHQS